MKILGHPPIFSKIRENPRKSSHFLENPRKFSKILGNIEKIKIKKFFLKILGRISTIFDDFYRPGPLQTFPDLSQPSRTSPNLLIFIDFYWFSLKSIDFYRFPMDPPGPGPKSDFFRKWARKKSATFSKIFSCFSQRDELPALFWRSEGSIDAGETPVHGCHLVFTNGGASRSGERF